MIQSFGEVNAAMIEGSAARTAWKNAGQLIVIDWLEAGGEISVGIDSFLLLRNDLGDLSNDPVITRPGVADLVSRGEGKRPPE
jgi:hypothetical protein